MVSGGEGGGEMERIVQIQVSDGGGGGSAWRHFWFSHLEGATRV